MSGIAGNLKVILTADGVSYSQAFEAARRQAQQLGTAVGDASAKTRHEMSEAKGSIAVLGEEIGVRLPRHVRSFVAELPGVSAAMAAAFNAVAVIAIAQAVFEAGKKIVEFVRKNEEAAAKTREAFEAFGLTATQSFGGYRQALLEAAARTDELRGDHLGALKKQLEIINLQGFDKLESAFGSLQSAAEKTFDSIQKNWIQTITQLSFSEAPGFKGSLDRFGVEYKTLLGSGNGAEAQKLLNDVQQREEQNRADIITLRNAGIRSFATSGLVVKGSPIEGALGRLRSRGITDYSDATYNASVQATQALEDQQKIAAYQRSLTGAEKGNAVLGYEAQQFAEELRKERESIPERIRALVGGGASSIFTPLKAFETKQTPLEEAIARLRGATEAAKQPLPQSPRGDSEAGLNRLNELLAKNKELTAQGNAQYEIERDRIAVATGKMTEHAAAINTAKIHAAEYKARMDALLDTLDKLRANQDIDVLFGRGAENKADQQNVRNQIAQLEGDRSRQLLVDDANNQATSAIGELSKAVTDLSKQFTNVGQVLATQFTRDLQAFNQTVIEVLSTPASFLRGQHPYRKLGATVAQSAGGAALQFGEGEIMKALFGRNSRAERGSKDNRVFTSTIVEGAAGAATSGVPTAAMKGLLGVLNDSNWASGLFGGKLFGSGSVFGHFANGGAIRPSIPSIVGERGPELFMPSTPGTIIPNGRFSMGSSVVYAPQIDARGAGDPSAVNAAVNRALSAHLPGIVQAARAYHQDQNSRGPTKRRF